MKPGSYRGLQFISQVVNGLGFCAGQASSSPSDSVNCFNMDPCFVNRPYSTKMFV